MPEMATGGSACEANFLTLTCSDKPTAGGKMASIEKALQIAVRAHEGQKDKDGQPYIFHPLRLMNAVEDEPVKIVAVLHDVVEDTSITYEDLRREGFEEVILAAVECLTHRKDEPYADYVVRCKSNVIARHVKLADLEDNARPSRALLRPDRIEPDIARLRKYFLSYKFLTDMLTEEEYRAAMAGEN